MRRTLITNRARSLRKAMSEPEVMLWSRLRGVAHAVLLRAQDLISAERQRMGLAPSTIRSSADGPPPAASRGR